MVTLGLFLALGVSGCTLPGEPDDQGLAISSCFNDDSDPDKEVEFAEVLAIISRAKAESGCTCHDPGDADPSGFRTTGLDLTTYGAILEGSNGGAVVVPSQPCESLLYRKVTSSPGIGERMPRSGAPFLSDEDQMLIHDWIAEGANAD